MHISFLKRNIALALLSAGKEKYLMLPNLFDYVMIKLPNCNQRNDRTLEDRIPIGISLNYKIIDFIEPSYSNNRLYNVLMN